MMAMLKNVSSTAHLALSVVSDALMKRLRTTTHDQHWQAHPAVPTGSELTFGERAADRMKAVFATWSALFGILAFIAVWVATSGLGRDPFPYILLNLCLSCLAALQCFILLIAAKRADQIAGLIAQHTLDNTQQLVSLIQQNTALTETVATLTRAVHDHITAQQAAGSASNAQSK